MGFEVLDAGGPGPAGVRPAALGPAGPGGSPVPVVAYEELDPSGPVLDPTGPPARADGRVAGAAPGATASWSATPADAADPADPADPAGPADPADASGPGADRGGWRGLGGTHHRGLLVAGLVVVLLAGLLAGIQVGAHRERAAELARARGEAVVAAEITTENSYATGSARVVGLNVRLVNYGTTTVDVVESGFTDRPRVGRPRVRTAGAQTDHIAPRGTTLVAVTAVLDCVGVPRWPTVPVRTVDGSVHQVELASAGLGGLAAVTVCAQPATSTYHPVTPGDGD